MSKQTKLTQNNNLDTGDKGMIARLYQAKVQLQCKEQLVDLKRLEDAEEAAAQASEEESERQLSKATRDTEAVLQLSRELAAENEELTKRRKSLQEKLHQKVQQQKALIERAVPEITPPEVLDALQAEADLFLTGQSMLDGRFSAQAGRIALLQAEVGKYKESTNNLRKDIDRAKTCTEHLREEASELQKETSHFKEEINGLQQEKRKLQQSSDLTIKQMEQDILNLNAELTKMKSSNDAWQVANDEQDEQLNRLRMERDQALKEQEVLKAKLNARDEENKSLRAKLPTRANGNAHLHEQLAQEMWESQKLREHHVLELSHAREELETVRQEASKKATADEKTIGNLTSKRDQAIKDSRDLAQITQNFYIEIATLIGLSKDEVVIHGLDGDGEVDYFQTFIDKALPMLQDLAAKYESLSAEVDDLEVLALQYEESEANLARDILRLQGVTNAALEHTQE